MVLFNAADLFAIALWATNMHTTPTLVDKQQEFKKISDDISLLKQQKETLTREVATLVQSREELIKKTGFAPHDYKKIEDEHSLRMQAFEDQVIQKKQEKTKLEIEITDLTQSRQALIEDIKKDEAYFTELQRVVPLNKAAAEEAIGKKDKHTKIFEEILAADEKKLFDNRQALATLDQEYALKMTDLERKHTEIMEEERLLSIKRSDIEIYEERLRKRYPETTFIL